MPMKWANRFSSHYGARQNRAQRKMKLDEHIKHKSIQRKKNVAPPKAGKTETTLGEIWESKQKPTEFY